MIAALDIVGNPSSVHAEGRGAKSLVEKARAQVADLVGCKVNQVIFTSGATEAAALAVAQKARHGGGFAALPTEHDCLSVWSERDVAAVHGPDGALRSDWREILPEGLIAVSAANSETGVMSPNGKVVGSWDGHSVICDITQMAGKLPIRFQDETPSYAILSAHKLGGPKGVGALINFTPEDPQAILRGGGQEMGRRSGTENVVGIAGFGAAAEAAGRDIAAGLWERVAEFRNILETALEAGPKLPIFVGKGVTRLPNTSCIVMPGWKGETQVMQMDLAGFAISAGSACSSGKVRASRVLQTMGYDAAEAASAIRVSLGLNTTEEDVLRFADVWRAKREKHEQRAA